jgi:nitrous oxidase accessory protein NosD
MRRTIVLLTTMALTLLVASGVVLAAGIGSAGAQGSVVGPGESIQKAINAADPGDTIVVRGVHREDVVIRKNGIKLRGVGDATLKPPARAGSPCSKAVGPEGICILGDVDPEAGEVNEYVKDVSVSGFTIKGFDEAAIEAVGASNATITGNRAVGSGDTAIGTALSVGTKILTNVTRGPGGAGIGLAEAVNTKISGNDLSGHDFTGIFVGFGSQRGSITANRVHDNNCAGMTFVAIPPGPTADFEVKGNTVTDNRGECGIGIGLFGARRIEVAGNNISGNVPNGQEPDSGGVVVAGNDEGTAPRNNTVVANNFGRNKPDIRWDRTGSGNVFGPNNCNSSVPSRLCN